MNSAGQPAKRICRATRLNGDSELSLIGEVTAILGPLGGVGEWLGRSALALLRQLAEGGPAAAAEQR